MSAPSLEELAARVATTTQQLTAKASPAQLASTDQAWSLLRDHLARLGVDLNDPAAARAVIAVFELAAGGFHSTLNAGGDPATGYYRATNIVTALAAIAAQRHAPRD